MEIDHKELVNGTGRSHNHLAQGKTTGLKILIAGAGIGGLSAALALRRAGHRVEIFESSRLANETGAAIHLAPNANGVLRRLGVFVEKVGANTLDQTRMFTATGQHVFTLNHKETADRWQHPWMQVHRAHLHEALKLAALSSTGKGHPAQLHTSSKITQVDPYKATFTLKSGETLQGDVVLGADGVHSATRGTIASGFEPFSSGHSAFRFLITRKAALDDPITSELAKEPYGSMDMWHGADRKIVMYPCNDNETLNFVCVHPAELSITTGDYLATANKSNMLELYKDFEPRVQALLAKADPETLKVWTLLDMKTMPTWTKGRFTLLGDAAHPFTPHLAQGGAMAIEDAASLAVMLPGGLAVEDVPARLRLYEKARYKRATDIQHQSRLAGQGAKHGEDFEAERFTRLGPSHDEFDYSTQLLREYQWSLQPKVYWRQPTVFGPMPGPRQTHSGMSRAGASLQSTSVTASFTFKTSSTILRNLFPSKSYSFVNPETVAYASFRLTTLDKMDWLGGGGYNHFGLYIHGVQYEKKNGQTVRGTYLPVLFEDLADPILSGREELGFPKLYSAMNVGRREKSLNMTISWQGAHWGSLHLRDLEEPAICKGPGPQSDPGILIHKHIPRTGTENRPEADADYPVITSYAEDAKVVPSETIRVQTFKHASFEIQETDWDVLPTLHHVVSRLAEVPIYEVVEAKVVESTGVVDLSSARRIE